MPLYSTGNNQKQDMYALNVMKPDIKEETCKYQQSTASRLDDAVVVSQSSTYSEEADYGSCWSSSSSQGESADEAENYAVDNTLATAAPVAPASFLDLQSDTNLSDLNVTLVPEGGASDDLGSASNTMEDTALESEKSVKKRSRRQIW